MSYVVPSIALPPRHELCRFWPANITREGRAQPVALQAASTVLPPWAGCK